jgi:hypothetical protein
MPTNFKHAVEVGIGTTPQDLITIPEGFRATVIGCNIANTTSYDNVNVDLFVVDASSTSGVYVNQITIPPNSAIKIITNGEKLILPENSTIRVRSNVENSIDVVVSYVEIS